jgi:ribokinase
VTLCARVGADPHGDEARRLFAAEGIASDAIIVDRGAHTGVAIVLVDRSGENAIAVAPGSNDQLSVEDLSSREALFAEASTLLLQLETPLPTVHKALELGRRHGCITILDPAPAAPLSDELLAMVDLLTPNESETASLVGAEINDLDAALAAGHALRERGCGRVLVTLGSRGSVLTEPSAEPNADANADAGPGAELS